MADNMLGTLAKWLRVAGVDCEYADGMEDDELVEVARSGRRVLTRDRLLAQRCGDGGLYVPSDDLDEQLIQVFREFPAVLDGEPLSRCLVCNVRVEPADPSQVVGRAPEGVLERHDEFWTCPRCGRAYWAGTHVEAMLERLSTLREQASGKG
ncbi:MAG: Mut7-C RNAse domain-containing protein [Thermoplasmata archaeon]|nr:MAG: Mut7-C RNAse domain-containing protein [Thermoplasmata archaeon]